MPPLPPRLSGLLPRSRPSKKAAAPPLPRQAGQTHEPQVGDHRSPPAAPPQPSLDGVPVIAADGIESIDVLNSEGMNPIWKVQLRGLRTGLIVKAEQHFKNSESEPQPQLSRGNVKAMNDITTIVSPTSTMIVLSQSELDAIKSSAHCSDALRNIIDGDEQYLLKMIFDSSFFSTSADNVMASDFNPRAMTSGQQASARLLFGSLRGNQRGWQTLGQIVIADALNGNADRIDIAKGKVANFGNLIFSRGSTQNVTHALGYDSVYHFDNEANIHFGEDITRWIELHGRYVKEKSSFGSLSEKIMKDIFNNRLQPLDMEAYKRDEIRFFKEGMIIGWDKLANRIGAKVRAGIGIPSGLMARAKYLGWVR